MSSRAARRGLPSLVALLLAASFAALIASPSGCAHETPCMFNSECPIGYCQDGVCKKNCLDSARDCPAGFTCDQNAQCVPGSSSSVGSGGAGTGGATASTSGSTSGSGSGGATTTTTTVSASVSGSTTSTTTTVASSSSTSGGTGEHELELCTSDAQCVAPLLCRPMVPGGAKRCTRPCPSSGGCMAGTRCELVGGTQYCAGDDIGRTCSTAAGCNFGCLGAPPQAYCTAACSTGSDCPNGYGCMGVGTPPTQVCVKAEVPCATGSTSGCIGPAFCDESPTLVVGGCSTACSSAFDCPQRAAGLPPWTCDGVLCRRPSDVSGPLQTGATPAQYACNAQSVPVNVCNDNQHIDFNAFNIPSPPQVSCSATTTTDGIATDSCVDSCRYEGGCPYGFACVAVGGVGSARIGLCLPTGAGEVGTPCVHDSQCAFGYCTMVGACSRDCTFDGVCPGGTQCLPGGGPAVEGLAFRRCQ